MSKPPVSVVVVSRGRPDALCLCLLGISQLHYPAFEVIVVADPEGLAAAQSLPFANLLKFVPFDVPNISAARNAGIAQAGGELLAFIDDDAVPEPTWLTHLTAPFTNPRVGAAGGFVRGRNGISFQWQGRKLHGVGFTSKLALTGDAPKVFAPETEGPIKTEGTNMALRRTVLAELGGFDEAFHFYLDETDLNLRLAAAGHATAVVPLAQVHHGFAASDRRRADRVPLDLFQIGASWAVFQRKHMTEAQHTAHWQEIRSNERRRALTHMVNGRIEPRDVSRLMGTLEAGYSEGLTRPCDQNASNTTSVPFRTMPESSTAHHVLTARSWQRRRAHARAREMAKDGAIVTLLLLSPTALYHRAWFHSDGYWVQNGGQFGKSLRSDPIVVPWRFESRNAREIQRILAVRGASTCLS